MPDPTPCHPESKSPGRDWIMLGMIVSTAMLTGRCDDDGCNPTAECYEWAEGSPLDNVDAAERRARIAQCDAEAAEVEAE